MSGGAMLDALLLALGLAYVAAMHVYAATGWQVPGLVARDNQ